MKRRLLVSLGMFLLVTAGWLVMREGEPPAAESGGAPENAAAAGEARGTPPEIRQRPESTGLPVAAEPVDVEKILKEVRAAALTYDGTQLPVIQPYLVHPSRDVREAAVDAMVTLGDRAAGAMLREAAGQMADPREAVAMLDAAEFIELPSAKISLRKKVERPEGKRVGRQTPGGGPGPREPSDDADGANE